MKTKPVSESTYVQEDNKNLYEIFNHNNITVDWSTAKILDFGCNVGNYLNHATPFIDPANYVGLDLNENALTLARARHPEARFVHYNRRHQSYNPNGVEGLRAADVLNEKFDVIIAYSVFTHATVTETKTQLDDLRELLNPGGCILFTMWSDDFLARFQEHIASKSLITEIDADSIEYNEVLYWIDYERVVTDVHDVNLPECIAICTFYKMDKFAALFPTAENLGHPPGRTQSQKLFKIIK